MREVPPAAGFLWTGEPGAVTSDGGACSSMVGDSGGTAVAAAAAAEPAGRAWSLSCLMSASALTRPPMASTAAASALWSCWMALTATSSFWSRSVVSDMVRAAVFCVVLMFAVLLFCCFAVCCLLFAVCCLLACCLSAVCLSFGSVFSFCFFSGGGGRLGRERRRRDEDVVGAVRF